MNDHEILTLAAFAAGYKVCEPYRNGEFRVAGPYGLSFAWNPLLDKGDSLGLAVRLHFAVKCNGPDDKENPDCTVVLFETIECPWRITQKHAGDPESATCRAITRAAAEVASAIQSTKGKG